METDTKQSVDTKTADAFATSWNNLPTGSVYTFDQFVDWVLPLQELDFAQKNILELGCGNGSLITHAVAWHPNKIVGVDLGDSVQSARANLSSLSGVEIVQEDLTTYTGTEKFDVVYCIGVLHHLKKPKDGFESVLRNTKVGGQFHCWVYAREGNAVVRYIVDPIRRITSKLPWWFTKYGVATPLVVPFYVYAKLIGLLPTYRWLRFLPLYEYAVWIAKRNFMFFRHVAFDQLVTPQTAYISKETIQEWLSESSIKKESTYIIMRNGNSWKFGGVVGAAAN